MYNLYQILIYACASLFIGFYALYSLICLVYVKVGTSKRNYKKNYFPSISLIIPTYNEEKVIPIKVNNLKILNYPKNLIDVVFVDGNSTDDTVNLIKKLSKELEISVKVVEQDSRKGFNSAIIEGFDYTKGDIIIIPGAETEYHPDSLLHIVRHFSNPEIGAVTGREIITNKNEGHSIKLDNSFINLYNFMRQAESNIDSPFDLAGEISAAHRGIVENLISNPKILKKGCIDACFSFQARTEGFRTVYEPNAVFYNLAPQTMGDSLKQRIRRSATLIENLMLFKNMIFNPKYGAFGLFIIPAHLLMLTILPFLFFISAFGIIILAINGIINQMVIIGIVIGLILIVLSKSIQTFIRVQVILVIANLKLLFGVETQKFKRIESTRLIT